MFLQHLQSLRHLSTYAEKCFYVTTPIFYVNAAPHIGHLYSAVIADAICRYEKLKCPIRPFKLCTGTDEHGTKVQQAAEKNNTLVGKYCDDISQRYKEVFDKAGIQYSDFIRTTEQRHKKAVTHFWTTLKERGHIYSDKYSGWYCVSDETFLTDSQLRLDATTGKRYSLESGHPVEWTEERNYMFGLSKIQDEILYWLKQDHRVKPLHFEKILFDMLCEPLPDVSISRPLNRVNWAIPVPDDPAQTVYVWLDALVNYLTSVGYPDNEFLKHWPADVHVIGKDILKFHGIYWPAFLIAAGLEPPKQLFVHSHWTVDGQKMSKSKNNVVSPDAAAVHYTMEGLRYFLLREGVAHSDGNYSSVKALRILNSELADTLGNLLSRVCAKSLNPHQIYPTVQLKHLQDVMHLDAAKRLQEALSKLEVECSRHYEKSNFYLAVDTIMSTLHAANNFFETARPWEYKMGGKQENEPRLECIISMTMDALRLCGIALQPIVPHLSERLLNKLSVPLEERLWYNLNESFVNTIGIEKKYQEANAKARPLSNVDAVLFKRITMPEESSATKSASVSTSASKSTLVESSSSSSVNIATKAATKSQKKKMKKKQTQGEEKNIAAA